MLTNIMRRACCAPLGGVVLIWLMLGGVCGGCNRGAESLSLDKNLARESLTAFLECWQGGEKADSLQSRRPAIIGRDPDWEAGRKLAQFQLGAETDDGTNLHVQVNLTFDDNATKTAPEQIRYTVGTSPVISIQRSE